MIARYDRPTAGLLVVLPHECVDRAVLCTGSGEGTDIVYAVVETGGKQYRVAKGQTLLVERLDGERGQQIELDRVLLVADGENMTVGQPIVPGARIVATIGGDERAKKIIVFKYKRKTRYRR